MELINRGILFVFNKEVKRDILTFFRKRNIYCEAIKEDTFDKYIEMYNPKFIIADLKVNLKNEKTDKVKRYNLEEYNELEFEKILNLLEKYDIEKFWNLDYYIEYATKKIKESFLDEEIPVLTLSTGVDSTVLAILLSNILDRQIKCINIDTGLNRIIDKEDLEYLRNTYTKLDIEEIDISDIILKELEGVIEQDKKKDIVKTFFRETLNRRVEEITENKKYKLVHGTIVTDTFNLFQENDSIIAPLNCLIKPEIRALGKKFGLKDELTRKLKFPVIGYGRKIIGEINKEKLEKVKEVDYEFCKQIINKNIDSLEAQYIDVSIIINDNINIMVFRVDRRIIDNNVLSYDDCISIIRMIEKKFTYIDKSLLDVSNDTDSFLVKR